MREFLEIEKRSKKYIEAVKVLQELLEEAGDQGIDVVSRAFAEAVSERIRENYLKARGLKETHGERCIQRLRGVHCKYWKGNNSCECRPPDDDHAELLIKGGAPHVYISQPYGIGGVVSLRKIIAFCEKYGFDVDITAYSWWFPSQTLLLEYTKMGKEA